MKNLETEINQQEKFNPEMSRRKFLGYLFGATTMAGTASYLVKLNFLLGESEPQREKLDKESLQLLVETVQYRERIGLQGLPSYLIDFLGFDSDLDLHKQLSQLRNQEINLPERWSTFRDEIDYLGVQPDCLSYAQRAEEITRLVLGDKAAFFLKGIISDQSKGGNNFNRESRHYNLNYGIRNQCPELHNFIGLALHECVGHGTDPESYRHTKGMKVPGKDLIKMIHGKWKMLSKSFSIPEELLNNRGDGVLPSVKFLTGVRLAGIIFEEGIEAVSDDLELRTSIEQMILDLSGESDINNVVFNRTFCQEMGEKIVGSIRAEENPEIDISKLNPRILEKYRLMLEVKLGEIYAEMVRLALSPNQEAAPDNFNMHLVQADADIVSGLEEILSVINGKPVDLTEMRRNIEHPSPEIMERWEEETGPDFEEDTSVDDENYSEEKYPTPEYTANWDREIENPDEYRESLFELVDQFYQGVINPAEGHSYTDEELEEVQSFANQLKGAVELYPDLEVDPGQYETEDLHIWDMIRLAHAANKANIINIVEALMYGDDITVFLGEGYYGVGGRTELIRTILAGESYFAGFEY